MPSNHLNLCHPLSSFPRSFPALGSFPMSWLFASVGQSIGYTYPFFFWTSSHLDHHRALNRVRRALLVVYFIHSSVVVQLPSPVRLFATHRLQQARIPSFTISQSLLKFMSTSRWCHPTISSSAAPFSSFPQSFPALRSFPISWLFASIGQSIWSFSFQSVSVLQWIFRVEYSGVYVCQSQFPNLSHHPFPPWCP